MSKTRSNELQKLLANELRNLARVLEDEEVIKDAGQLKQAGDNCRIYRDGQTYFWTYDVDKLIVGPINLKANRFKHFRPRGLTDISIEINVSLTGQCLAEGANENPFTGLQVDLEIFGETIEGDVLSFAMHLDRQPDGKHGDPDDDVALFAHPGYHFHFGGRKLWHKADNEFGTNLLLESPRLPHPPLDAILAIDFVLSNYHPLEWRRLRDESSNYKHLVESAQKRYWKPYAVAAVSHWENYFLGEWNSPLVWPNLFSK